MWLLRDRALLALGLVLAALVVASVSVGVGDLSLAGLARGEPVDWQVLLASRVPRTAALGLVGMGMSVAGLIMQLLAQNRFVEPSTVGTVECAILGLLVVTLVLPNAPVPFRTLAAAVAAFAGTAVLLRLLRLVPLRSTLTVPLIGIMFGGVVAAVTTFIAYRFDMLQSLAGWTVGDFSTVLRGRYELLWLLAGLALLAYAAADRLTVAGLGQDVATNLGLDHRTVVTLGLGIVCAVTAVTVTTVGTVPFLGLVVPNLASLIRGDNLRRSLPLVAALGAGLVLGCDVLGRLIRYPFEVPVGTVMGVVGSALFLLLLLRRNARLA